MEYISEKGSACVEAFREISHSFSRTFGYADHARRSKEVNVAHDLRLLTENLMHEQVHVLTADRPVNVPAKQNANPSKKPSLPQSAIIDAIDSGATILNSGKFSEFVRTTTWDPALGYPVDTSVDNTTHANSAALQTNTSFDRTDTNPLEITALDDVDDGDDHTQRLAGLGSLGGGIEYEGNSEI